MDIKTTKLIVSNGGRMLHTKDQHEVVCFRPDDFEMLISKLQREEREACAEIVQGAAAVAFEGPEKRAAQAFMLDNCARAIRGRSNAC